MTDELKIKVKKNKHYSGSFIWTKDGWVFFQWAQHKALLS